jgi:hypothetical protein
MGDSRQKIRLSVFWLRKNWLSSRSDFQYLRFLSFGPKDIGGVEFGSGKISLGAILAPNPLKHRATTKHTKYDGIWVLTLLQKNSH